MALWLVFALMTAAAIFAVLWPRGRTHAPAAAGNDIAVYRDQLDEIARDRATGLIGEAEAEAARVGVSRRLIAAADSKVPNATDSASGGTLPRRAAALGVLIVLPALAAALYLKLGSPQLPGQPLAARATTPLPNRTLDTLVAQVEEHLAKNPDDGHGWEVVAPVYMRLGRFDDAVKARRNALRLNGGRAVRGGGPGEGR